MAKALAFQGLCRLQVDSTSQLSLQRFQGGWIPTKAAGAWQATPIPASGPTVSNSGLTAATLYYVYAFDSAGVLALDAPSTTAPATDTDTGIRIKTGDATRTLVGMVYMGAGSPGTFIDSATRRLCFNWFNRRALHLTNTFSADRTTTSGTFVEVNSEIQLEFLSWADEATMVGISGTQQMSNAGQAVSTAIGIDSTTVSSQSQAYTAASSPQRGPLSLWLSTTLSEGRHFATLLGAVSANTGTWETADAPGSGASKARLWATVRG
jgi:hypothetical protein